MYKANYEMKAKVLEIGLDKLERKVSKYYFCQYQVDKAFFEDGVIQENHCKISDEELIQYNDYINNNTQLIKEAHKVNDATYKRNQRLRKRIADYMNKGQCIFLTLTFTDEVLESTSKETRKKYVKNQLKLMSSYYVANIDYGAKNEREHYHAVVVADKVSCKLWPYGAINFEKVRATRKDSDVKLSKYINKLTNHAIKETCQNNTIIYSRNN